MRFGQDVAVVGLMIRCQVLWLLGYPDAALADAERALKKAREIGHAATLLYALSYIPRPTLGNYTTAKALADEGGKLASEKGALFWRALGVLNQGSISARTGKASEAVQVLTNGLAASRQAGSILHEAEYLALLARAYAEFGQFDDAWRCVDGALAAMETTKEKSSEAEVNRIAGEISLKSPEPDAAKAESYFAHALAVAREQQAKSWELRAAMSMARLWHDQGKRQQAHDLLALVYDWFTEGFDMLDLKEAKALLDQLA
jgi:predicted ATPase